MQEQTCLLVALHFPGVNYLPLKPFRTESPGPDCWVGDTWGAGHVSVLVVGCLPAWDR